ncbi:hypothetical protein COBT_001490 [Conglomerata obtusa]
MIVCKKIDTIKKRMNDYIASKDLTINDDKIIVYNYDLLLGKFNFLDIDQKNILILHYTKYLTSFCNSECGCNDQEQKSIHRSIISLKIKFLQNNSIIELSKNNFEIIIIMIKKQNKDQNKTLNKNNRNLKFYRQLLNFYIQKSLKTKNLEHINMKNFDVYNTVVNKNIFVEAYDLYGQHCSLHSVHSKNTISKSKVYFFYFFDYLFCLNAKDFNNKILGDAVINTFDEFKTMEMLKLYDKKENLLILENTTFLSHHISYDTIKQQHLLENLTEYCDKKKLNINPDLFVTKIVNGQISINEFLISSMRRLAIYVSKLPNDIKQNENVIFYQESLIPLYKTFWNEKKIVISCYDNKSCVFNILQKRMQLIITKMIKDNISSDDNKEEILDMFVEIVFDSLQRFIFFDYNLNFSDMNSDERLNKMFKSRNALEFVNSVLKCNKILHNNLIFFENLIATSYDYLFYNCTKIEAKYADEIQLWHISNIIAQNYKFYALSEYVIDDLIFKSSHFYTASANNFLLKINQIFANAEASLVSYYINFHYDAYFTEILSILKKQNKLYDVASIKKLIEKDINENKKFYHDTFKLLTNAQNKFSICFKITNSCNDCRKKFLSADSKEGNRLIYTHGIIYQYLFNRYQIEYSFLNISSDVPTDLLIACQFSDIKEIDYNIVNVNNNDLYVLNTAKSANFFSLSPFFPNNEKDLVSFINKKKQFDIQNNLDLPHNQIKKPQNIKHLKENILLDKNQNIEAHLNEELKTNEIKETTSKTQIKHKFSNKKADSIKLVAQKLNVVEKKQDMNKNKYKTDFIDPNISDSDKNITINTKNNANSINNVDNVPRQTILLNKLDSLKVNNAANKQKKSLTIKPVVCKKKKLKKKKIIPKKDAISLQHVSNNVPDMMTHSNTIKQEVLMLDANDTGLFFEKAQLFLPTDFAEIKCPKEDLKGSVESVCSLTSSIEPLQMNLDYALNSKPKIEHSEDYKSNVDDRPRQIKTKLNSDNNNGKFNSAVAGTMSVRESKINSKPIFLNIKKDENNKFNINLQNNLNHYEDSQFIQQSCNVKDIRSKNKENSAFEFDVNKSDNDTIKNLNENTYQPHIMPSKSDLYSKEKTICPSFSLPTTKTCKKHQNCPLMNLLLNDLFMLNKHLTEANDDIYLPILSFKDYNQKYADKDIPNDENFNFYCISAYLFVSSKIADHIILSYVYGINIYIAMIHDKIVRSIFLQIIEELKKYYNGDYIHTQMYKDFNSTSLYIKLYNNFLEQSLHLGSKNEANCLTYLSYMYAFFSNENIPTKMHVELPPITLTTVLCNLNNKKMVNDPINNLILDPSKNKSDCYTVLQTKYNLKSEIICDVIYCDTYQIIINEVFTNLNKIYKDDSALICTIYNKKYGKKYDENRNLIIK